MFDSVLSPRFATYTHVYLLSIGIDPEVVFNKAGIEFQPNQEYTKPLSPAEMALLFNSAAEQAEDNYFGMRMGANCSYESAGLSILTMASAPNLQQGLSALINYGKLIDNALDQRFTEDADSITHSKYLLRETRLSLAEIAYEMGYSEDSAFNRAFRGWTGCTPQWYRKEAQGPALEDNEKRS